MNCTTSEAHTNKRIGSFFLFLSCSFVRWYSARTNILSHMECVCMRACCMLLTYDDGFGIRIGISSRFVVATFFFHFLFLF